jgi:hypothetical protein
MICFFQGAFEYLTKTIDGNEMIFSRLFLYYNARLKRTHASSVLNSGCSITNAIESLERDGICLDSLWPFHRQNLNCCPIEQAYQSAELWKMTDAFRLDNCFYQMKSCLAQGFPFVFGLTIFRLGSQVSFCSHS